MNKMSFLDCVDLTGSSVKEYSGIRKYVSTGALDCDHIDENAVEEYSFSEKPSRANLEVDEGSLLFAKMQGTQKTLVIDKENQHNIYSTGFAAVKPKNNIISARCLYHLVTSDDFLKQKDLNCSGATQKAITNEGLKKIAVSIPDLCDQARIARILDEVDELRKMLHRNSSLLDDIVKSRFVEMFGDPIENPMGWDTKPLLSMGKCKNGMNFHYDEEGVAINCLGVGDFKDNSIISDTGSLPEINLNEMPSDDYLLKDDDIVFVRSNGNKALVGRSVAVYPGETPTTFSGFCIRYRLVEPVITVPYLLRVLKSESVRKKMAGRGANIQNLNQQILGAVAVPIPPMELQKQFSNFMAQTNKSKLAIQKELEKLVILKKSLMQKYFG